MFEVVALPAFSDNYIWLLSGNGHAVVVDPGVASVVDRALSERRLTLDRILLTHHHADHIGGVDELVAQHGCRVFGPQRPEIDGLTDPVVDGDIVEALGASVQVLGVPGHTRDHLAYWCPSVGCLFCGDTLFGAGCGRLFEGTPQQMWDSLSRLAALPAETLIYCAHEYTQTNLRFAQQVDPTNPAIVRRRERVELKRAVHDPSVPFPLSEELATNPFLRSAEPSLELRASWLMRDVAIARKLAPYPALTGPAHTFAALRAARDVFA